MPFEMGKNESINVIVEHSGKLRVKGKVKEAKDIAEEIIKQKTDPSYEEYVGPDQPINEEARIEYLKDNYSTYFTENGFDNFINSAFLYHWFGDYQMSVTDIETIQSDNPDALTNYTFTAQVKFGDKNGEKRQYEISGKAICPEEGKIGSITITDNDTLRSTILENEL